MAATDITAEQVQAAPGLPFTTTENVYSFHPSVDIKGLEDQLSSRQTMLEAMLAVGSAAGSSELAKDDMESYFWACRSMAEEIRSLTYEILNRMQA